MNTTKHRFLSSFFKLETIDVWKYKFVLCFVNLKCSTLESKMYYNGPKWFPPPPNPIHGVSKSLLPGSKHLKKNELLMISMIFKKKIKKYSARWLKKRVPAKKHFIHLPEGVQKEEIQQ